MTERGQERMALVVLLAAFFAAGLVILPIPFTRDQGIYAYNAWRWLADDMLYRDVFGHKGPLLYAIYAFALDFSHGAMWGPNLFDLLARTAGIAFVFALARQILSSRGALFAAVLTALPLFGVFSSCWWNAQAETFMLPLIAASAWLCLRREGRFPGAGMAAAGFLTGQAIMLKPTAALHALFLLGWLMLGRPRTSGDAGRRGPGYFAAGTAAGVGAWIGYFYARGALADMWELLIVFNYFHAEASGGAGAPSLILRGFWPIFNLIPVLVLLLVFPARGRKVPGARWFIPAFMAESFIQVVFQGRFFLYHWLVLIPAMGLAAGAGLDALFETLKTRRGLRIAWVAAGVIMAWLVCSYGRYWWLVEESYQTREYLLGKISRGQYYARFNASDINGKGDFNLLASAAAASYAREHVPPNGRLLVFGYEPIVNYLSGRPAPTRFEIDYPLTFIPRSETARQYRDKWRAEFMADLVKSPPDVVILVNNDANPIEPQTSAEQAREFTEFWQWLPAHYTRTDRIEDFEFYRLKP